MAHNNARLPVRTRAGPQRLKVNGDENATSKHIRQPSGVVAAGAQRAGHPVIHAKAGIQRPALGEVTTTAVNRKDTNAKLNAKEKEKTIVETGLKRSRSSSLAAATGPQRIPLGPGRVAPPVAVVAPTNIRAVLSRFHRAPAAQHLNASKRASRFVQREVAAAIKVTVHDDDPEEDEDIENDENSMDIVNDNAIPEPQTEADRSLLGEQEVEAMVDVDASDEDEADIEETAKVSDSKALVMWPEFSAESAARYKEEIDHIRETFEDEVDEFDTTMVTEYADDIFEYMNDLEEGMMPSSDYMTGQHEITWGMRQTLVDWLLQVHLRYHMLPETLWIAINLVDRFLTKRVVSLVKLQLVGVTAMFIAAKYEEVIAPSVQEFVDMTEKGYTKEEILKGERIVLQTLDFKVSHYCSPYSWMRKISKADDYDIQTRTLSKFLTEVTLLDYRFLPVKPSLLAAVGMYSARKMLNGDWNVAFAYYSGYTEEQLIPGHQLLIEKLAEKNFWSQHVCKKYAHKKFLKASMFAIQWAKVHVDDLSGEEMVYGD